MIYENCNSSTVGAGQNFLNEQVQQQSVNQYVQYSIDGQINQNVAYILHEEFEPTELNSMQCNQQEYTQYQHQPMLQQQHATQHQVEHCINQTEEQANITVFQHGIDNGNTQLFLHAATAALALESCTLAFNDFNDNTKKETTSKEATMNEVIMKVEPLTPVDGETPVVEAEVDALGSQTDPFTYLSGLNSDNLMQFSQQSAIQELMKEQLVEKPNLDVLPTLEEHDFGGYKFELKLNTINLKGKRKSSWLYSESLNKVYIRMNDIFNIEAVYTPKEPAGPLRIRAFLSFVKEVSEPVVRCQNHLSKDMELNTHKRNSLLRCENPLAEYCGTAEGKNINERYSVLIPLSSAVKPSDDNSKRQTIALKFSCQNSCIGRKETSLIFLLESISGEILSQRALDVKICSCPKRDKAMDERNTETSKRKINDDLYPRKLKIRRQDSSSSLDNLDCANNFNVKSIICESSTESTIVKKEEDTSSDMDDEHFDYPKRCDVQRTESGNYLLTIEVPTKKLAVNTVQYATGLTLLESLENPRAIHNYRYLRRLHDKVRNM